jgi:hypothetical protein
MFALLLIIVYQSYTTYAYKDKIFCTFRRRDKTKIEKWVKSAQGRIAFDNGWYDVDPARTVLQLKWMPLPIWIRTLDFRHDSSLALHPDTFDNTLTPEGRKQMNITDDLRALEQGNQSSLAPGKLQQGMLSKWLPIIVIVGFVIIGYFVFSQQKKLDMLGAGQNFIEQSLSQLLQK